MSARVLVVDDMPVNLRLMQALLAEEYYDVLLASSGQEALDICHREMVDLVLLDVMMPGLDGYEVCRRLKADPATLHIPVVLVTALDQQEDRVRGLESGADDFLTKPVRALPLISRIRSLTRLKILTDELRVRAETTARVMIEPWQQAMEVADRKGRICAVLESREEAVRLIRLIGSDHDFSPTNDPDSAVHAADPFDLYIVDLHAASFDPLRLCSRLRSNETTRQTPILLIASPEDEPRVVRGLELGANDYCQRPLDKNELMARIRTQLKRKRYDESLRRSLLSTIELATIDPLTGLYNRRFLEGHLSQAIEQAERNNRSLCVLMLDIDHFKRINDTYGHDAGDEVLRQFAEHLKRGLRASDLAARIGGEEFAIIMPDAEIAAALSAAERLRRGIEAEPLRVQDHTIALTTSIGVGSLAADGQRGLMKRADMALYKAKRDGRNKVEVAELGPTVGA
ncbi:PleD family two-component system response regulator [Aureimonas ureilytica]|uniref:PleD family two-component system response regulator n=1 Tax=Aureimonas ureilytica TaxID=401562 RepID=UPI003CF93A53